MQKRAKKVQTLQAPVYLLRLYVTGTTPRSLRALNQIRTICEEHLKGRYALEVIDIYQQPALAKYEQIVATPTLVRRVPGPLRRIIGDLFTAESVLFGMDLRALKQRAKEPRAKV